MVVVGVADCDKHASLLQCCATFTTVKSFTVMALGVIVLTTKWLKPFSPELLMLF
jgi:hypothetical protein